jgi:hypothetical protein
MQLHIDVYIIELRGALENPKYEFAKNSYFVELAHPSVYYFSYNIVDVSGLASLGAPYKFQINHVDFAVSSLSILLIKFRRLHRLYRQQ